LNGYLNKQEQKQPDNLPNGDENLDQINKSALTDSHGYLYQHKLKKKLKKVKGRKKAKKGKKLKSKPISSLKPI
jgi:hypothetical protein